MSRKSVIVSIVSVAIFFIVMGVMRDDLHYHKTICCQRDTILVGTPNIALLSFNNKIADFNVIGDSYHLGQISDSTLAIATIFHGKPSHVTVFLSNGLKSDYLITSSVSENIFEYRACR